MYNAVVPDAETRFPAYQQVVSELIPRLTSRELDWAARLLLRRIRFEPRYFTRYRRRFYRVVAALCWRHNVLVPDELREENR